MEVMSQLFQSLKQVILTCLFFGGAWILFSVVVNQSTVPSHISNVKEITVSNNSRAQSHLSPNQMMQKEQALIDQELKAVDLRKRYLRQELISSERRMQLEKSMPSSDREISSQPLTIEPEPVFDSLHEDLSDPELLDNNPDAIVRERISQEESHFQNEQAYQQRYAEEFVRNAREHGLRVRLNKNLDVISVDPIKKEEPLQFPSNASSIK